MEYSIEKYSKSEDTILPVTGISKPVRDIIKPSLNLLNLYKKKETSEQISKVNEMMSEIEKTFADFKIDAKVLRYHICPATVIFEVLPDCGFSVNKITGRIDDFKLRLGVKILLISAPIPGKVAVGIEIPNKYREIVSLREILEMDSFRKTDSPLPAALGKDNSGQPVICGLTKMPHLLISGATGMGKSACINSIIISLLMNNSPDKLKFLFIDPKKVELNLYKDIPHLIQPIVTNVKDANKSLAWAVKEMEDRYQKFAETRAKNIKKYNAVSKTRMPYIVIIVDELSDLMLTAGKQCENYLVRLTAMARDVGIHLILSTQRPSVDVITGVIKANFPSRIVLKRFSIVDSRTILDCKGAEELLGNGGYAV